MVSMKEMKLTYMEKCIAILDGDKSKVVTPYKFKQHPVAKEKLGKRKKMLETVAIMH